jgi:hypothetical protein
MSQEKLTCLLCGEPAEWVRYTQFSGNHPYCEACAKKEKDFPEGDGSYSSWDKWPPEEIVEPAKEKSNRLHQIREEIIRIREEADAKIAALREESDRLFEESPTFAEIAVEQKFLYELYGPVCRKISDPYDAVVESEPNKGLQIRFKKTLKVFPVV